MAIEPTSQVKQKMSLIIQHAAIIDVVSMFYVELNELLQIFPMNNTNVFKWLLNLIIISTEISECVKRNKSMCQK